MQIKFALFPRYYPTMHLSETTVSRCNGCQDECECFKAIKFNVLMKITSWVVLEFGSIWLHVGCQLW
jgi:hypothetical protein